MNLKLLTEQKVQKQKEMENLLEKVKLEERAFTDEENVLFNTLESEITKLSETIEAFKSARDLTKEDEAVEENKGEDKPNSDNSSEEEKRALDDEKVFEAYIRCQLENRDDTNLTVGDNGAVIPTTIANKIIRQVYDISPILEKSSKYNIKGKLEIPYYDDKTAGKVNMAYADEFVSLESNIGSFKNIELTGFLAGALAKISKSLINNSQFNIVSEVTSIMAESIARFVEKELIHGTKNKVSGLSDVVLEQKTAKANEITFDDLIKTKRKIKQRFQKNSIWIMSPETLTLVSLLKDNQGRYLLQDDVTNDFGYTLLGKPVYESDNMSEIGSGEPFIYYGDMTGLATKFVEELEMEVLKEKYADQHAVGIVAWMEFDSKIEDAQKIVKLVGNTANKTASTK